MYNTCQRVAKQNSRSGHYKKKIKISGPIGPVFVSGPLIRNLENSRSRALRERFPMLLIEMEARMLTLF